MLRGIIAFELRYQLRNPVFWVAVAIFFLMGFGISASENVSLGTPGSVHENSPYAVAMAMTMLSLFYLFIVTAFCASAVVRDGQAGFAPVVRATPVPPRLLMLGRFLGGLLIACLGFLSIPLGIALGVEMPWVDPVTVGPQGDAHYLGNFLIFAVPNIVLTSAILFALAAWARSMMGAYLGAVGFVTLYLIVLGKAGQSLEHRQLFARFEPLGIGELIETTRYWTQAELNTRIVPLVGDLLFNRLFALGLGALVLVLTLAFMPMGERPPSRRKVRKAERKARAEAAAASMAPATGGEAVRARRTRLTRLVQFAVQTGIEMRQVLTSPGLIILALFAIVDISSLLWMGQTRYGTLNHPTVSAVIEVVRLNSSVIALMIAAFYGGELVWRERERGVSEIIDATPVPGWIMTLPKVLALFLVLLIVNLVAMATGLAFQWSQGASEYGVGGYFAWFVLPTAVDLLLIAVLAIFFQVVAPSKYVGWGLLFGWFVAGVFLGNLGYTDPLYTYSATSEVPLSDFQGAGSFAWGAVVMEFYWAMAAVVLMVLAHLLWPRGTDLALGVRVRQAIRRPKAIPLAIAAAALAAMFVTGIAINRNVHELNRYETAQSLEAYRAGLEKKYLRFERLPQPRTTAVALDLQLFPRKRRLLADGQIFLRNDSGVPIPELHVLKRNRDLRWLRMTVPGARLVEDDERYGYRIYRFARPLAPGQELRLDFSSEYWRRGFAAQPATDIVENGTFLNNHDFAPTIGMTRAGLLEDRVARRRQGLPDELHQATLDDAVAARRNYVRADWIRFDARMSTDADQLPLMPGRMISERVAGGRRTVEYRADVPMLDFYSILSARYKVRRRDVGGVSAQVFYHPGHEWNVDKMLGAMGRSIAYYRDNFGPYPLDHARIVEFPRYRSFAQSFLGTMPYSEAIGFVANTDDPAAIDFTSYVVAHELAHQYWAHQAVGADVEGATMTTETLSQYSALMVMKRMYGPDKIRRFLKYELDSYLRGRQGDVLDEQPLMRVENQSYIHYNKGSLAMYLLQEQMGEARVNRALARYLAAHRYQGPPYPRSLDVIAAFKAEAKTDAERALIADLFERITLYDLKAVSARSERVGGQWLTTLDFTAAKYVADGKGNERPVAFDEPVTVGLFAARPGIEQFDSRDVLAMERIQVRNGKGRIVLRSAAKPAYAGIDPYNFRIDRKSDDNIVKLGD